MARAFELDKLDCLYVGRGSKAVSFASKSADAPAYFYLLSYPAHAEYPTAMVKCADLAGAGAGHYGDLQQADDLQGDPSRGLARAASW